MFFHPGYLCTDLMLRFYPNNPFKPGVLGPLHRLSISNIHRHSN